MHQNPHITTLKSQPTGETSSGIARCPKLLLTAALLAVATTVLGQEAAQPAADALASDTSALPLGAIPPEVKFALTTLGFGGIAGLCVGYTLKKVAKVVAFFLGVVVIAVQFLAFNKFITIDWVRVQKTVPESSLEQGWTWLMSVLTYNMPFAGAFMVGLFLGFRKG